MFLLLILTFVLVYKIGKHIIHITPQYYDLGSVILKQTTLDLQFSLYAAACSRFPTKSYDKMCYCFTSLKIKYHGPWRIDLKMINNLHSYWWTGSACQPGSENIYCSLFKCWVTPIHNRVYIRKNRPKLVFGESIAERFSQLF